MSSASFTFRCVRCHTEHPFGLTLNCNHCGGVVDPEYDVRNARVRPGLSALRRYFDLLPFTSLDSIVDLDEGNTPTVHARSLGRRYGMDSLYLKDETKNPTRTTKDRMASVTLSMFRELGINEFVASSTGNSSTSFAYGVARAAGMRVHLFAGADFTDRHARSENESTVLHVIDGDFVAAQLAARQFAEANNLVFEGGFFNPGRREGLKLAYLEAYEQMSDRQPQVVIQAISSGMGIYGANKGAQEFLAMGSLQRMPKFVCVQQDSCSPMVNAYQEGATSIQKHHIIENPQGIAQAILRGDPTNTYEYMRDIVVNSHGTFVRVTEDDMRAAQTDLLEDEGIAAEFSAAAAVAAVKVLRQQRWLAGDETTLVNVTGNNSASAPGASVPELTVGAA